jgi:hypothetical protein
MNKNVLVKLRKKRCSCVCFVKSFGKVTECQLLVLCPKRARSRELGTCCIGPKRRLDSDNEHSHVAPTKASSFVCPCGLATAYTLRKPAIWPNTRQNGRLTFSSAHPTFNRQRAHATTATTETTKATR